MIVSATLPGKVHVEGLAGRIVRIQEAICLLPYIVGTHAVARCLLGRARRAQNERKELIL